MAVGPCARMRGIFRQRGEAERRDRGSISILTMGLFLVTVAMLILTTDIGSMIVAKRSLVHVTEAAAIRAVHELDLESYYRGGKNVPIPIDCDRALSRVKDELTEWISSNSEVKREELRQVALIDFSCSDNRVQVTTSALATLPFRLPGSSLPIVVIHARVSAESNRKG